MEEGNTREYRINPDDVEKLDIVQAAFSERDRIIVESKPVAADLSKKPASPRAKGQRATSSLALSKQPLPDRD